MSLIWGIPGSGWQPLSASGFPAEAALHTLVEDAPQTLPVSGATLLSIVGREVLLGNGYADLIAVEPSGRISIIEIKLAKNAEASRAVIAQVLTYAAYLHGLNLETLEQSVLVSHLHKRGYVHLADAVAADDQEGSFDQIAFKQGVIESLQTGSFRLVIVLDEAPQELIHLVGYLEAVSEALTIDLITVATYDVNGTQILVPQRIDPERQPPSAPVPRTLQPQGHLVEGSTDFIATIDQAPEANRDQLRRLADWANGLEQQGLVHLFTYHGTSNRWTLLPRIPGIGSGLVTIWNDNGAYLSLWRSVFERVVPQSIPEIERLIAPATLGQGKSLPDISDELLDALAKAYREAALDHSR